MERIIELQIEKLYKQRETLVYRLSEADPHAMNYGMLQMELRTSIDKIDMEVQNSIYKLENILLNSKQ